MLERLLEAARNGTVEVGVASHNLFDVGFSLVLAEDLGVKVEIEMLAGMADEQAAAIAERTGGVLLYVPVAAKKDFRNALAYLSRRLDENTSRKASSATRSTWSRAAPSGRNRPPASRPPYVLAMK